MTDPSRQTGWRCVDCGSLSRERPSGCPDCGAERFERIHLY